MKPSLKPRKRPPPPDPAVVPGGGGPNRVGEAPIAPGTQHVRGGGRALPMPHERDETTGHTDPEPVPVIEQARRDIESGQVDTDLRATPGLDAERRRQLVPKPR